MRDLSIPVASLLFTFQSHGFNILAVYDGEERIIIPSKLSLQKQRKLAKESVVAVDDAIIYLQRGDDCALALYLCLWNDPSEIVSDYAAPSLHHSVIDSILEEYYTRWEGKECPTVAS